MILGYRQQTKPVSTMSSMASKDQSHLT